MFLAEFFVFTLLGIIYYVVIAPIITLAVLVRFLMEDATVEDFERVWAWPIRLMRNKDNG